jgi:hypothetical protein
MPDFSPLPSQPGIPLGPAPLATLPEWWAILSAAQALGYKYTEYRDPLSRAISPRTGLLPVPFGQVRVGGTMLYVQGLGGDSLTFGQGVIAWSEGEIASIDAITANGGGFSARSDDIVTIAINQHRGEPGGETNPGNIFGGVQPGFANAAYTHWTITTSTYWYRWWNYLPGGFNDGPSSGGMDAVPWAADVHGLLLYDPRLDSTNGGSGSHRYNDPTTWTYSRNPILEGRYLLVKYGHLVNGVDIDDANIRAMAQASDDAGFTCDVVFAEKTLVRDALAVILQTCNGKPITVNGKAGFYLDIPNPGAAVGTFSEEAVDVWGLTYEWLSARDRYTQVAVSFANSAANYKPDKTPIFGDPGTFSSEPTKTISAVTAGTDTLTMAASPGWAVNDTVLFFQNGGVAIPGLHDGQTYFVKTISGADLTLAAVAGGATLNLTGSPTITTQYLQRVGAAYPPTMVVKLLTVPAPGVNTLPAAIVLRDYTYKASAITFRVSGTMNARGIGLQEGQKIHLTTLKGVDMDCPLIQISGDQSGFFSFVVKPYEAGTWGTTPITQGPPIVSSTRPNDINVTDFTQTLEVLTFTDATHDDYDVFQLIEYVLPLNYAATIDHLAVRGSEASGAQSQVWSDLATSEISVSTAGNATATDGTHENLYHTAVRRATRAVTYSTRPTILTDVTTEKTTRIIVKSISVDGSASNGVTTDYTAGVGPSAPPTTPPPLITSPLVVPPSGTATGQGGELQLRELAAGGTNSTGFGAPDALAADLRYILPATGPSTDGESLVYDAAGTYAGRKLLKFELPYVEKLMIETPSGALDGVNRVFTLSEIPMTAKIMLFGDNMQPLKGGSDYGRSGTTITFAYAANKPVNSLVAVYSYRAQVGSVVGSSETIPTSGTASTWTAETAAATRNWVDIAYSPTLQLFAAIDDGAGSPSQGIMTSPDLVTWTLRTCASFDRRSISWCNDRFVVGGAGPTASTFVYSTDGVTWTTGSGLYGPVERIVWLPGANLYVAVKSVIGTVRVKTSPDLVTWSTPTTPNGNGLNGIVYAPALGLLVAVGDNSVITSSDAVTWTDRTPAAAYSWRSVAWSPELALLVAVSYDGNAGGTDQVMTSTNGTSWTLGATPVSSAHHTWFEVVWFASRSIFVAVSGEHFGEALSVMTSLTGTSGWTERTTPNVSGTYGRWLGLTCADDLDLIGAVGSTAAGTPPLVMRSLT